MNLRLFSPSRKVLLPFTVFVLFIFSCKKNPTQDNQVDPISAIRDAFGHTKWVDKLTDPFNDTLSLVWSPNWDGYSQKSAEGVTFYYVPLKSTLRNKNKATQHDLINQITFQQYLVVTAKSGNYAFQRLTYIPRYRLTDKRTGQDITFNYPDFTGYAVAEDSTGHHRVCYFKRGDLLFDGGRRINGPAGGNKTFYSPQAKVGSGADTVDLGGLNPDPGTQPVDPLASECSTRCVWSSTCGEGAWNVTTTIAPPKEPCSEPQGSPCGNGQATVWRLNYSEKFNCSIPGKDPNISPPLPGEGGGGGSGNGNPTTASEAERQLMAELIKDPNKLIKCSTVAAFIKLASFKPNNDKVIWRLTTLNSAELDFSIQDIQDAAGTTVNMDFFAVRVTQLPNLYGRQSTPDMLLQYIRKNINNFTKDGPFSPYVSGTIDDTQLWNSQDPTSALVHINILGDDGAVIVSEFEHDHWIFTTIKSPLDGKHPVSGNRRFGIYKNSDGSYYIYTKGVDRLTKFFANMVQEAAGIPFSKADELWESFQYGVNKFINENGGKAEIQPSIKARPDWDLVKKVLTGEEPIDKLKENGNCE
ncbi:MAG TPA: hypothetical protein VM802_03365 [Chitinophaga sp.]|uniref:hypothetical protein n=1 Tax=Chitinophaga sp. TaxID=1869181 RepID=UPI002C2A9A04|nr:hypothetical protein [Chitinophaga sp.]HVI43874.1 hypothetical protein [Chitinophaga sp.]